MFKVFLFNLLILCINAANVKRDWNKLFDYCNHPDCSMKNQHTMCVAANKQSPRLYISGMTQWMRHQLLLLHNRYRDNVAMGLEDGQPPASNMRKMYWDYELEASADLWARQCQKRHDECRNTIRFSVLQNMDVRPITPKVTEAQLLADAVGAWFSGSRQLKRDDIKSFKMSNCSGPGGCNSHWYSAAAWAPTWRIGCAQAICTLRRPSCFHFRQRRDSMYNGGKNVTELTTENILRRTKYITHTKTQHGMNSFKDVGNVTHVDSPLYRGSHIVEKNEKKIEMKLIAYTFCNYGPAGNVEGFPIYNVGHTCSNCPTSTKCNDKIHRGLCTLLNDPETII